VHVLFIFSRLGLFGLQFVALYKTVLLVVVVWNTSVRTFKLK
jgi:hypothetical protein